MKRLIAAISMAFAALTAAAATLSPIQLLNPTGSTSGQAILSTGSSTAPAWGNVSISSLTGILPVANGGTNAATASGTSLDNIAGFSGTGFLTRTGAGAYAFQSATNGITLGNLAQAGANTVLANATGSTANWAAFTMPSCSSSTSALQWTSGTGFSCYASSATTTAGLSQFASTTSAQLAGVLSDETGTGSAVFGTSPTIGTPTISGGTINNASVGATTPSTGAFTTLAASSTVSGTGFSNYLASPPAIGGTTAAAGSFTTLSSTGTFTPSQTSGIVGTTTSNNANTGSVGEYLNASGPQVSATSGVSVNGASQALTAGDWDAECVLTTVPAGTTTTSSIIVGLSTTSATLGAFGTSVQYPYAIAAGVAAIVSGPLVRLSLSAGATAYCVANVTFGVSTMQVNGFIRARRVR